MANPGTQPQKPFAQPKPQTESGVDKGAVNPTADPSGSKIAIEGELANGRRAFPTTGAPDGAEGTDNG